MNSKMRTKMYIVIVLIFLISTVRNANADFTFGECTNLGPTVNSSADDSVPSISADRLILVFASERPGGYGGSDLWMATRLTTTEPWGEPVNLGPSVNSSQIEWCTSLSPDGCTLYYASRRSGGMGNSDIWMSSRATRDDAWSLPKNLGSTINTSGNDGTPFISSDGLELYFSSLNRSGGQGEDDIWVSVRETKNSEWGTPVNLGPIVNTGREELWPTLSSDGLSLFFSSGFLGSARPGGLGGSDLWMTRRKSRDAEWEEPVNLGAPVNSSSSESSPSISTDGSMLYFTVGEYGSGDLYQASIIPIVDFNGDGIVDSMDMCIMVDYWGTDKSLCDIGPMPWGDGVVDVQDLIVFSEHLFEDLRIVANWGLDEIEGDIAHDISGNNHGTLIGNPTWQPANGIYDGALKFDGIDDYMSTPFILDPAKGSLSAFTWIQGGAPGQVILSQTGDFGGTWLGFNPSNGTLMTGFSDMYFGELASETVITDNQWHHVGFVYDLDSLHRRLYVDGIIVAEDTTVVSGVPSDGGLHIGAGKDLDASTFFSGLIDDVRVYKVALSAEEIATLAQ